MREKHLKGSIEWNGRVPLMLKVLKETLMPVKNHCFSLDLENAIKITLAKKNLTL